MKETKTTIALAVVIVLILFASSAAILDFGLISKVNSSSATVTVTTEITRVLNNQSFDAGSPLVPDIDGGATTTITKTVTQKETLEANANTGERYILAGGQYGSWFTKSQYPRLFQIYPDSNSSFWVNTINGMGTVWGGGSNYNDTLWLISGWGVDDRPAPVNPYLFVYNGSSEMTNSINSATETEWNGGDIFAASWNGSEWLVSGMGSGLLNPKTSLTPIKRPTPAVNHLSMGLFDGRNFIDLSSKLPVQMDGILYANGYNGEEWLVGGGYSKYGVLFSFNGKTFVPLIAQIDSAVPEFHSVQSIAWNGKYWLIGGIGFLAEYDGTRFVDLTTQLERALSVRTVNDSQDFSVNSIAWNGSRWLLGGGAPVAIPVPGSSAWFASYDSVFFQDLTYKLPAYTRNSSSSILSISYSRANGYWVLGGYADGRGMLMEYDSYLRDLSALVQDSSYINWVGAS
jgi:hypothetical protein